MSSRFEAQLDGFLVRCGVAAFHYLDLTSVERFAANSPYRSSAMGPGAT